ncbi:restriction endonuclease fold toxin 5 domain-containing protein [Streptomyces sp. CB03238]|uniref:restriction endonuclease fold toxin 5 domain-containing protein n=1 Tax=Streptomyces sp. CB03238 TaxID=1907777 RepID=UPI001F4EDFEB|nr:restriction endonuclease fold toxin 5 domain-containing protein [Streptomyces sp. CB03238]
MLRDVGRRRRRIRDTLTGAISATALTTAAAVLLGVIQAVPAAADTVPEEDDTTFIRNSVGESRRLDRCIAGVALHVGGPNMKAKAVEGLTGTVEQLRETVGNIGWIGFGPLGQASTADEEAANVFGDTIRARKEGLEAANKPYWDSAWASDDMQVHAPDFGKNVLGFTFVVQRELAWRLGWDGHSNASPEAVAKAHEITEQNRGKDSWHDWAADAMLYPGSVDETRYSGGTTSSDIASYLRRGGFAVEAPAKDSAEYRVEVEDLKQAWAACDYQNPIDPRRKLNDPVMAAMAEWELEYTGQAAQRATIIQAEADAAGATRAAADHLIEALGQAWLADQILTWRKYWQDELATDPDPVFDKPDQAMYEQADADLAKIRSHVASLATQAKEQATTAATAAQRAATAQQEAWAVADTTHVPRGRGLMYAQQSVQVARASSAAAAAAAKATETALAAANATIADSDALLAKAQTQSHAINTEFRRVAAEEAASQAKAAADSAEAGATAAATSATAARSAQTTAEQKRDKARTAAATAATERAKAQAEQATAVASRAKAATERAKAEEAEQRAAAQQTTAKNADTAAGSATSDATAKRKVADEKAKAAQTAREKAIAALQARQATAARAAALEAAASAAEGTAAAAETRAAANTARTAANQAAEAATAAQAAADEATTAAVTARAAATTAEGAAKRAQAGANSAWSAYYASAGAASTARAAAAAALDASQDAALRADNAATASENATALAKKAVQEAVAAGTSAAEAVKSAATVVGRAYAAGQAALAARDSAKEAVAASAEAVTMGSPYQEKDSSAAFAVLVGQSSKTIAEQQAAAAEAKASEAAEAAEAARQAAAQATGDAKLAAEAAARAAADSARAVAAVARAQASAAEAAAARTAAKTAADTASGHAEQAGNDALSARITADAASSAALEADREATDAERHAAEANGKAGRSAEAAAEAARKAAEAEQEAKAAEGKASDATGHSTAAEEAAKKAEQEQREKNEAAHKAALAEGTTPIKGGADNWPKLGGREEKILLDACGQACVDDYRNGIAAVSVNVVEWAGANGGQILFAQLDPARVKECLAASDVEECLWELVDIPSSAVIVGRMPALAEAIEKVSTGMRKIFVDADHALRRLNELTAVISDVRSTPRLERCVAGVALHAGGAKMKAKAIEGLSGTNGQLHAVIGDIGWLGLMPLGQARDLDRQASTAYMDAVAAREALLEDANRPYAMSSFDDGITLHAPEFGAEVLGFTLAAQAKLADRLGWDAHTNAGPEAIAKAREITEQNRGKDSWHDWAADAMLRDSSLTNTRFTGGTTSTDIATYLRHGGFPAGKVAEGSAAFRIEVENLKQAWATCNHQDPVDPRNALSEAVSQASAEWEAEYAAQAAPRAVIMQAEADAAAATRAAADTMVEAIGQAWLADQILRWQKYWHDQLKNDPDHILKPKQALFDRAKTDLAKARGKVQALVTTAKEQAGLANTAAQRAVTAQQDAWAVADAAEVPRGRGLMYAQQSVQVTRASGAAATAAAKATETALNAANATVATSEALLALAQTQAHALKTEFRRIAAQEAAAQAKAAADSADAYAASAAANAATAKKAKETALAEEEQARQAAADAQASRAVAELERANAAAYRATAESERDKAKAHEADAVAQGRIAGDARLSAEAAGSTAAARRGDAEQAERDAVAARDKALEAEQRRDSLNAKAAALEAHAAAVDGTDAAEAARAAANDARAAANTATTAATNARAAANAATAAATNARTAATQAQGSAARAKAAADDTWASYLVAAGSAAAAHAAAAEAIDASQAAAADAKGAKEQSEKASAAAKVAKTEAAAARTEALQTASWAAITAGKAHAAVQASLAARDSAAAVIKPANEAIALGGPYQEVDSSAAFAVLTGQQSLTVSQQQAAAAAATASMAEGFSAEAKALAEQAAADMKLAAQAASAAAADALRAAKAYQRAQASATQAAADAKAAQASANRADGYAQSAGDDAMKAWWAASDAEQDAAAADNAATEAEKDAASARAAATQAEADAASARDTATQAEADATAAEKAAVGAWDAAAEAQQAADRTETAGNDQQISEGVTTGIGGVWAVLDHIEYIGEPKNVVKDNCNPIIHFGDCTVTADITYKSHVDLFMCLASPETYTGGCPDADTVYLGPEVAEAKTERLSYTLTMVEFNSGIDPIDVLLGDFIGCAQKITPGGASGSWGDCAWAAGWFVAGALFKSAKAAVTAMDAAIKTGVGFTDAWLALRSLGLAEGALAGIAAKVIQRLQKACQKVDDVTPRAYSFAAYSTSSTSPDPGCWFETGGPGFWVFTNENKSAKAVAYEFQITGIPAGLGYQLRNTPNDTGVVAIDGYKAGVLQEAKGPTYAFLMGIRPTLIADDWVPQALRQVRGAPPGTPISWYIAEEAPYLEAKKLFAANPELAHIKVIFEPPAAP